MQLSTWEEVEALAGGMRAGEALFLPPAMYDALRDEMRGWWIATQRYDPFAHCRDPSAPEIEVCGVAIFPSTPEEPT